MRKLLWFTIGFAIGCGLCVTLFWQKNLLPMLLYAAVCWGLCFLLGFRNDLFRFPTGAYLGLAISFAWFFLFQNQYLRPIQPLDGATLQMKITASDYSERTDYGFSVEGFTVLEGRPYRLRLFHSGEEPLSPGEVLDGEFRLRLTVPGGKMDSSYYQGNGVFLVATQKREAVRSRSERNDLFFLPPRVAQTARERIAALFPKDTAAFAKALLLGDTSNLSYSVDTALKISGIRHVVAVSGLHVSIVFSLVYLLFRGWRWLTFLVSVPLLLFFAGVTGFSPSVTRACLMCGLMAFGGAVKEEYDSLTSLSFAVLCMLVTNPFVLLSVSFQLSVASVLGILLFALPIANRMNGIFNGKRGIGKTLSLWFSSSVSVSLAAMIFSTPFSAYYFGTISLVGVLTNLLTIWLIAFLFYGVSFVSLFGGMLPTVCRWVAWLISWPIRFVLFIAQTLSKIPFAALYTQSGYVTAWLVFCYVLLALYLMFRRWGRRFFAAGAACLVLAVAASVVMPRRDNFRFNVLDVGEGQAILLQSGGQSFLIDCGGSSDTKTADQIAQTLLSQGVFHLDGLVLTHYDRDHSNAIEKLETRIPVNRFYLPVQEENSLRFTQLNRPDKAVTLIYQDYEIPLGTGKLTLLEPGKSKNDNENSMCVLFESAECVILITGDRSRTGERALLEQYQLPPVDVLIAGHHGSKNATSYELLEAVQPQIVIISVGENSYGHPAQEVLNRLAEYNCTVYRTDLQGSVLLRR